MESLTDHKKFIKSLKAVRKLSSSMSQLHSNCTTNVKHPHEYEPLFDLEAEAKIAKTKLVLMGVFVDG